MTTDDLSTPLGQGTPAGARRAFPVKAQHVIVAALSLALLAFAGWAMLGGEPVAVVPTALLVDAGEAKPVAPGLADNAERTPRREGVTDGEVPPAGMKTVTIIDGSSGKRQAVVVPNTSDDTPTAPVGKTPSLDDRLTEPGRHGPLPKVAQDGARPADVFARPVKATGARANAPRIALVVGGLGISASATGEALRKLPDAVTLAFAPYGADLERQVARAREAGHEVLLQVPMEPFDYPDNDPGPQTLLTSLDAGQNIDRLHWAMSRFQGYVGIVNAMGARFSATEQSMALVLRETAKRGLIYLDDGSSPRSLASQIAGANNVPFVRSDLAIDTVPTAADVDRALGRLETIAREHGMAVAVANALPVSLDRIVRWAKAAEGRGFLLVPVTAAVAKAKSS
jgi:uncharacterized protein